MLNEQCFVIGEVDDIDVFIVQFVYNVVNMGIFYIYVGVYWINMVIVRFYCYFCMVVRDMFNMVDGNQAVFYFRYFLFQEFFKEQCICVGYNYSWVVVVYFYCFDDVVYYIFFVEKVIVDGFGVGKYQFIVGSII